jgi:signal transduction histidine kinase/DNA-binding response OmpR family regulator
MKFHSISATFESALERLSLHPHKDSFFLDINKFIITSSIMGYLLVIILMAVSLVMKLNAFTLYCTALLIFWAITITAYVFYKKEGLILIQKIGTLLITFYFITRMGGLLTSGGIIFIGIAPVFYTLIFRNFYRKIIVYFLLVISTCLLAVFDPLFPGKDIISESQNLFLFTLNFLVITTSIFLFAFISQRIFTNLEHKEVLRQKELNEAKSRLYTNITHEFRTPLTVILGIADLLKKNSSNDMDSKSEMIKRNAKYLLRLVNQLLELNKLESGNLKLNKVNGNIIQFLRYIFYLNENYRQGKKLDFHFHSESQNLCLDFDPEKITKIFSNLLSNAIKFTPDGGSIRMDVKVEDKYLTIDIRDNGIGIPKDQVEKIFERFHRVDDSLTRKSGGTGIGLSIVKELVTLMEGKITLHSDPGKKTVFTVKLPLNGAMEKHTLAPEYAADTLDSIMQNGESYLEPSNEPLVEKQRLLIIEDNEDVVSYLQACFNDQFAIVSAFDGEKGYNKALDTIPDIIICDIMMPELDGYTVCRKLKEDYRTSHIPIILLTAKADISSRIHGLEQGADDYIIKPFDQLELSARIHNLLELRKKLYERYSNGNLYDMPENPGLHKEDNFFIKVRDNIIQNLQDENYNVQALCEEMAMSKSQIYRKFKALTNKSIARYIRKLRMDRAKHLLLTTSLNVSEVSYEVGIKTLSTFSEIFKEEFGCSPRDYLYYYQKNQNGASFNVSNK